jgi:hypothetical protein
VRSTGASLVGRRTQDVEDRELPGFYGGAYRPAATDETDEQQVCMPAVLLVDEGGTGAAPGGS